MKIKIIANEKKTQVINAETGEMIENVSRAEILVTPVQTTAILSIHSPEVEMTLDGSRVVFSPIPARISDSQAFKGKR